MATTMKAVVVQEDKTVKVEEKQVPLIQPNEVLLKVVAVGLNPTDWKHVDESAKPGYISGCDFVGEVTEIGASVPTGEVKAGELRWAFLRGGTSHVRGGFAEFVPAEWDLTSVVPHNVTPQEAASIPIPYLTAVQMLYLRLGIPEPPEKGSGKWILIWSGSSSVGQYAIQLAKLSGLKVATTASQRNWDLLKSYGADLIVDYKDPDVSEKLKEGTGNAIEYGIDCISEGGSMQKAQLAFGSAGGQLVTTLPGPDDLPRADVKTEPTLAYTLLGQDQPMGPAVFKTSPEDRALYVRWAKLSTQLFAEGKVKPLKVEVIGNLDAAQKGMDLLRKGGHSAKLVLNVP